MNEIAQAFINTLFKMPKGLYVTFKHIFKKPMTLDYPHEKRTMPPRYRGRHYLERYDDGTERCVCCGLCAAACPADAIYMEPTETENGERQAKVYEINLIRCIYCGFCEEACPEEAIFLGHEYEFSSDDRDSFIYAKEQLLVPQTRTDNPFKRILRRTRRAHLTAGSGK